MIGSAEARAGDCAPPSPECYLETGKRLLGSDPKRAAEALLQSYQLDERTDTLALYAGALELDHHNALALETWRRVVVFRDAELEAAKTARKKKRGAIPQAQQKAEQAAQAVLRLWPAVGRVRIKFAPGGGQLAVTRDGVEVDATHEFPIDVPRTELVFTRKDGATAKRIVEASAGQTVQLDAPDPNARPPEPPKPAPEPAPEPPTAEPPAPMPAAPAMTELEEPRSTKLTKIGIGVAAAGVVLGGIAAGVGYNAGRDYDRAQDLGCSDGQCPIGRASELADRSNDRARYAQILAIGGGALVATGAVMWFVGRKKQHREVAVSVGPSAAAVAWRF